MALCSAFASSQCMEPGLKSLCSFRACIFAASKKRWTVSDVLPLLTIQTTGKICCLELRTARV